MGEPVGIYAAFNELDEAKFVASQIQNWVDEGGKLDDCAVLYRSNSQSRVIEEALIRCQIPYRIYGGMRFFERQEIKDALAYLRLINNRQDDAAFERVINTPTRGIGDRTLDVLRNLTRERQITLWQAVQVATQENMLTGRASTALLRFQELINSLQVDTAEMPLFAKTDFVIKHSGLYDMYKQEKGEKGEVRIENLEELVAATREFIKPDEAEDMTELTAFLTHASLEAGEEQASPHQSCVEMMTLHSAKGLEFPRVFMVGVEEGYSQVSVHLKSLVVWRRNVVLLMWALLELSKNSPFVMLKVVVFTRKKNAICLHDLSQNCHQSVFKKSVCEER